MPGGERVIYVADFSGVLAPASRLGFIVADPEIIAAARELRGLIARHPPLSSQRTVALMLSLGHYDVAMLRLGMIFRERLFALREALNHYLQRFIAIAPARGGTTVPGGAGAEGNRCDRPGREAALRGILIEPVAAYFTSANPQRNLFRMGITGLPATGYAPGWPHWPMCCAIPRKGASHGVVRRAVGWAARHSSCSSRGQRSAARPSTVTPTPSSCAATARCRAGPVMPARTATKVSWWVAGERWFRQWRSWAYGGRRRTSCASTASSFNCSTNGASWSMCCNIHRR